MFGWKMSKRKLIPHIRFKEFEEEWKTKKLEEITEIAMGQSPSSKNYLKSEIKDSYVLIQGNADIKNNKIVPRVWTTQATKLSNPGDIILTVRAPVGELARNKFQAVIGRGVSAFKGNDFLFYYLQKLNIEGYWQHLSAGSTFESVSSKDIASTATELTSIAEQQKIGNLLAKLDRLLDLQQQKLDQLELLKKALLQKLFPKQGTEIPELRFKGFEDEWKQEQFSYLYKKRSEKNDLTFGPDRIISVANMYFKQTETRSDKKYMKTYNVFRIGDIAFEGHKSKRFSFGRFVENTIGDGIVSHVFEVFRPITSYDLNYWKYAIHNEDFMGPILRRSTIKATMMNNLIEKDFLKQKITVPKLSEQQKIGNLLAKVDHLIEVENKKFSNLKQIKKSLLQNMFVE